MVPYDAAGVAELSLTIVRTSPHPWYNQCSSELLTMSTNGQPAIIELGSKVSVRRNGQNRIGIVTSLADEYVTVR